MKMKTAFLGILAGLLLAAVAFAAPANKAPEKLTIDGCKVKKSATEFPHKLHVDAKISCEKCHHTQKGLKAADTTEVKKCSACHLKPEKEGTLKCDVASTKKNAYHVNCITCHKADKKGPTKCKECHPK